ncbi:hypothetical protein ACVIHH_008303 [Bradyrhizobium sp. USDA 4518]
MTDVVPPLGKRGAESDKLPNSSVSLWSSFVAYNDNAHAAFMTKVLNLRLDLIHWLHDIEAGRSSIGPCGCPGGAAGRA